MDGLFDSPKLRNSIEYCLHTGPQNYKFEQCGMLVYDIYAQTCKTRIDSPQMGKSEDLRPPRLKPKGISQEDWKILMKLQKLDPYPTFKSKYNLYVPDDKVTLEFNSKFESGNLYKAVKLSDYEYSLQISADMHTSGNNHWYYFSVKNPRRTPVTFHITNMKRQDLLYKTGLKPAVYSTLKHNEQGISWHRDGYNISYSSIANSDYYCLTFTYAFFYENDTVFFAYSYPYTYTDLLNDLSSFELMHPHILRVNNLCKTLVGNDCPILTITEDVKSYLNFDQEISDCNISAAGRRLKRMKRLKNDSDKHKNKKGVVLTARVHAGETVSSFMMKGAIKFLLKDCKISRALRKRFIFKVIPMLNPDGVRFGNYRCSLIGVDLNRRWDNPSKILHPTIFAAKKMIQVFHESHPVLVYCDMHGHGRKKNVFMYGCNQKGDFEQSRNNLLAKLLPFLIAEENKLFSFGDSHFRIEKDKLNTARIVLFKEFGIVHSYTIEASFFGPRSQGQFGDKGSTDMHMNKSHLEGIGESLCKSLINFCYPFYYWTKIKRLNEYLKKRSILKKNTSAKSNSTNTENFLRETLMFPSIEGVIKIEENNFEAKTESNEEIRLQTIIETLSEEDKEDQEKIEFNEDEWEKIDVVEDISEDDSGGSESCPSERESVVRRSKISLKREKKNVINLNSNSQLSRNALSTHSELSKIPKIQKNKITIIPKLKVQKMSVNLPIVTPRVADVKSDRTAIPPLNLNRKYTLRSTPVDKQYSLNIIKQKTVQDMLKTELNSTEINSNRPIITPRNYKITTLGWLGSDTKEIAKKIVNDLRYKNLK